MRPNDEQIENAISTIMTRAEITASPNSITVKMDSVPKFYEEAFVKLSKKYRRIIFLIAPNKKGQLMKVLFEPHNDGAKMTEGTRVYLFDKDYNKKEITEKTK